jgi:hypothetical protein
MYTKEYDIDDRTWMILDPDGVEICVVRSESEADGLLSHLNRGQ